MACKVSKARSKPYKIFDGEGLYLEVFPSGSKLWRLKYRLNGIEKRKALGSYPNVSLLSARQEKDRLKELLKSGIDPVLKSLEEKQLSTFANNQTFEDLAKEWHSKGLQAWDPRYAKTVLYRLEKYTFHEIGSYPITQLKPMIILSCIQKIEKTAPEMARRIKQLVSHVFRYAIVTGRAEMDYTNGLEVALKKYRKGHFASIDVDELPELLKTIHNYQSRISRQTYLAIRLMLLTFVRTSELIEARWSEINFDKAMWTIPAERMKMRSPHLVPLSTQSVEILQELKEMNGHREHVFPSIPKPKQPMSIGTILVALKRMGYSKRMTGHGFRSLAMGVLKEKLNFPHDVIDRQLAHLPKSTVDRAYDRAMFIPRRIKMMQVFATYLESLHCVLF